MYSSTSTRFLGSAILVMVLGAGVAVAGEPPGSSSAHAMEAPSKAMREKMAAMHEQMASCLRSDKPMSECRSEMMKRCRMTGESCPMMGKMGTGGMGMGMGGGMHDQKCPASDKGTGHP